MRTMSRRTQSMPRRVVATVALGLAAWRPEAAHAQPAPDLFDTTVVRELHVDFADDDWLAQLDRAGEGANVRADLTVDGAVYPGVGLRYKGLSSMRVTGPKKPFNLSLDAFAPGQRLYGVDVVNLNNSYADPSHLREVLTNELLRPLLPTPRGAYARLYLEGSYWGLYVLSEQIEGTYVDAWFGGAEGLLVKADSPTFGEQVPRRSESMPMPDARVDELAQGFGHQSNLTWRGEGLGPYRQHYEVKTAGAGDAGYAALRELTRALDAPVAEGGLAEGELEAQLVETLDVDAALWYLAATNAVMNYDSYYFGHNYFLYRAEEGGRWVPLLWDTNLSLGVYNIAGGGRTGLIRTSPFLQERDPLRPLVRRLLAVPRWRADYLAHFRTVRRVALDAAAVAARGRELQAMIRPALAEDRNRLYDMAHFDRNLEEDVSLGPGAVIVSNGEIPGIVPLVRARAEWLDTQPGMAEPDAAVATHERAPDQPGDGEPARVGVRFEGADVPVAVEIVYRVAGGAPRAVAMAGGAEGWEAGRPGLPARARVSYFARAAFADGRAAFYPAANLLEAWRYRVAAPALPEAPGGPLALNELQADNVGTLADEAGEFDDWVELVNRGDEAVALGGYFLGTSAEDAWAFPLPAGTLAPGERLLVWCDDDADQGPLHAPFRLRAAGEEVLLSTRAAIVDRVAFGPQAPDASHARVPDGGGAWTDCPSPSPGEPNRCEGGTAVAPTATATVAPLATATGSAEPSPPPGGTAPAAGAWRAYVPWAGARP